VRQRDDLMVELENAQALLRQRDALIQKRDKELTSLRQQVKMHRSGAGHDLPTDLTDKLDADRDWVLRHTVEAPATLRDFLGGDGLSLEGKAVLDVGCGDGLIDWGIVNSLHPKRLVGVDLALPDTNQLISRLRHCGFDVDTLPDSLTFTTCTVDQLPFPPHTFDWVISWSAFEHIHDPSSTIREIRRVLKPSGLLFVQLFPFYWSEHGSHLDVWYPEGFAQQFPLEQIASHISSTFARHRLIKATVLTHHRHGTQQPGDEALWEHMNLNRLTLDDLHRALMLGGFVVTKVQLISHTVHLPISMNIRSLSDLLIGGVLLIAVPSPLPLAVPTDAGEQTD
jgi:ubiquinone/menaquinone biosynthesis C-methylase UbiE